MAFHAVENIERSPQRASRISGSRLHKEPSHTGFAQDVRISHAVQRHTSRHTQVWYSCFPYCRCSQKHHHVARDLLDRSSHIFVKLIQCRSRLTRWSSEQSLKFAVEHAKPVGVRKTLLMHVKTAVCVHVDEMVPDQALIPGCSVGRKSHDLVFSAVHLEPEISGERGIQQSQRMRKADLVRQSNVEITSISPRRRLPFPYPVDGQHGSLRKPGAEECTRCMRSVVTCEEQTAVVPKLLPQTRREPQLLSHPHRHGRQVLSHVPGSRRHDRCQKPLEFHKRLFIEDNRIQVVHRKARGGHAIPYCVTRKGGVMLFPREPFLLRSCNRLSIDDDRRPGIMIIHGQSEDAHESEGMRTFFDRWFFRVAFLPLRR